MRLAERCREKEVKRAREDGNVYEREYNELARGDPRTFSDQQRLANVIFLFGEKASTLVIKLDHDG
jgi:hypothetical protein